MKTKTVELVGEGLQGLSWMLAEVVVALQQMKKMTVVEEGLHHWQVLHEQ